MKKRLSIFLTICLLLTAIPFTSYPISISQTVDKSKYDGGQFFKSDPYNGLSWNDYKLNNGIPSTISRTVTKVVGGKTQTHYFNMELFADKGIIVYGDYTFVTQDFKPGTGSLDIYGNYVLINNQGYYAGGTGEYRYHGLDAQGELYANGSFPIDAISGKKAEEKKWVYKYWSKIDNDLGSSFIKDPSLYNRIANGDWNANTQYRNTMIAMINNALPFELLNTNKTDKNAYNYANVMTAPTSRYAGEVEMVNWGWSTKKQANSEFYQIFSTNTTKQKIITPVESVTTAFIVGEGVENDKAYIDVKVNVRGELQDQHLFDGIDTEGITDEVRRAIEYNRDDIDHWTFELRNDLDARVLNQNGRRVSFQAGATDFTIRFYSDAYENRRDLNGKLDIMFWGKASCVFVTGEKSEDTSSSNISLESPPVVKEKTDIHFDITVPNYMLDTEKFKIVDNTVIEGEDFEKWVELEGVRLSESEMNDFLSGNYLFPLLGEDKIYTYNIHYSNFDDQNYDFINYVVVYTTKPKAQFKVTGTFKENRLIEANSDITNVNSAYLRANASFSNLVFDVSNKQGDNSIIKYGTKNSSLIQFIVKGQTAINLQMQVRADVTPSKIERYDIPVGYHISNLYNYDLFTVQDYKPAMSLNIWNPALLRNETLDFTYDASSVDGDFVTINTYEIYYDLNSDGVPEQKVKSGNYADFDTFKPDQLGVYKIKFFAEETFGEPTLAQHITASDKRNAVIERTFSVENLSPMAKLFTDIEYDFPQADVIVLTDKDITRETNSAILNDRVSWMNTLRQSGIDASVQNWDLFTYTYSQDVSPVYNTGSSVPSQTKTYSSGGYSGTVNRIDYINNPYQYDAGRYVSVTKSDYFTGGSAFQSGEGSTPSTLPSKEWYDDGTFKGWLGQINYVYDSGPIKDSKGNVISFWFTRSCDYGGTLYATVQEWQSDWRWADDYTGYYAGTIYKYVKQSFTPVFRMNSNKYIVYFSDSYINHKDDIQAVLDKGSSKIILVGKGASDIESQFTHDYFIDNSEKSLDAVMAEVNRIIIEDNPYENNQLLLVNESFTLNTADYDFENDPIEAYGLIYVHDSNYYDNTMGQETGTSTSQANGSYTTTVKSSFSKVGHYTIYRKTKDIPIDFIDYSQESNLAKLDIFVHRKPIADFSLDWDYDSTTAKYLTTWVDKSYDLDHQFSDAQKGIRDRRIMYRKTSGDNVWIYSIPNNLTSGTYELRYSVKDIEGAWSDEKVYTFTLASEPPIQFKAELRPKVSTQSLSKFPIGQTVQWYDVWSRFAYAHHLEVSLWDGTTRVTTVPIKTVNYSTSTALKMGNDYAWNDIDFLIPKGAGLQEKTYTLRIEAISNSNSNNRTVINRSITLVNNTPPTVSFVSYSPSTLFQGLEIINTALPVDIDGDILTLEYYAAHENDSYQLVNAYSNVIQGKNFILDPVLLEKAGNYKFKVVATDTSGTTGEAEVIYNVKPLVLENLRVKTIYDYSWKKYFYNTNMNATSLTLNGIPVSDFPIYKNKEGGSIKLGYSVLMSIDSIGFIDPSDYISIQSRFFLRTGSTYQEVELYVKDTNNGAYKKLSNSIYHDKILNFTLTNRSSLGGERSRWEFGFYLPPNTLAVPKGQALDIYKKNYVKGDLLVSLDIIGSKPTFDVSYDYTSKETAWSSSSGSSYGSNLKSSKSLLGKGIGAGEIFFYTTLSTNLDDIKLNKEW
ncbi:MAG: hypothetical protein BGO41_01235 [Clostridiales bacterium 38-18]|nr:MAG: hypothetical protein BGO41_01235 [Clostridiales bacterium 38-18]